MNNLNNEILAAKVGATLLRKGNEIGASDTFMTLVAVMTDAQNLLKDDDESAEDYHEGREELYQLFSIVWDKATELHDEGVAFPDRHAQIGLEVLPSIAINALKDNLVFSGEALVDFTKWTVGVHASIVGDFKLADGKAA